MRLIDGGLSTELERLGAKIQGELWTGHTLLQDPDLVHRAHRNYIDSGAEVIITASYQLSRQGFEEIGLTAGLATQALHKSVEVAKRAADGTAAKVAASVGPYGAVLHDGSEYRGVYQVSLGELEDFHFERLSDLLEAEPDLLAVETIPNVLEARALANVLREVKIPSWVSFTAGSGTKLWSGEYIRDAAAELVGVESIFSVGVNCVDPAHVAELVPEIHQATSLPAIAYPNRGGVWDSANGRWGNQQPRSLAQWVSDWKDLPIGLVGGCCGTTAQDIAEIKQVLVQSHNQ